MRGKFTGYRFYERLLKALKRQLREIQGPEPDDLKLYYRHYAREIERARPRRCDEGEFGARACVPGVVLVGDFHTLDQAQKQFLRVLDALKAGGADVVVGLEMVQARHDEALRNHLRGRLTEGEFLDETGYFEHWGFDYGHYRPVVHSLKRMGIEAHGLNCEGDLPTRDRYIANRIVDLVGRSPEKTVLVLVGDLHLCQRHLPRELKKRGDIDPLVLYQNSETIHMRALRNGGQPDGWWDLGGGRFLVNNTPPWVKLQTFLTWLEHGGEAMCSLYGFCRWKDDEDGEVDMTETVHQYIRILKDLFELRLRSDDDFQVFTLDDLDFLEDPYFSKEPGKTYALMVRDGRPAYLVHQNTIYIPILDVNRTAQEAAHFLMGRNLNIDEGRAALCDRIHYYASGYVASKLINPLRHTEKSDEMKAFVKQYKRIKSAKERRYLKPKFDAFRWCLSLIRYLDEGREFPANFLSELCQGDRKSHFAVAEMMGRNLGEALYDRYNRGELSGVELKRYIFEQHNPFLYRRRHP